MPRMSPVEIARSLRRALLPTDAPAAVRWNITSACPLDCRYCVIRERWRGVDEMEPGRAAALVDGLGRARVATLSFSGGEPLLRPDLAALARRARRNRIRPTVNTGGTLIDAHREAVREMDLVKLSLDGPREIHDPLRGPGTYDAALGGLEITRRMGIPVEINTTLTAVNCTPSAVAHVLELARDTASTAVFQRYHPHGEDAGGAEHHPSEAAAAEVADLLADRCFAGDRALQNDLFGLPLIRGRSGSVRLRCSGGNGFVIIEPDGSLVACDRVQPRPSAVWAGGALCTRDVRAVPMSRCGGCSFSGSLRLNVLYSGWRGAAFVAQGLGAEARLKIRRTSRP